MDNRVLAGVIAGIAVIGFITFYLTSDLAQPEKKPQPLDIEKDVFTETKPSTTLQTKDGLIKFATYDDVKEFLKDSQNQQTISYQIRDRVGLGSMREGAPVPPGMPVPTEVMPRPMAPTDDMKTPQGSNLESPGYPGFSTTNVQVQNVDEPDYIKNDGKYLYIVNQNWLTIVDAYPAKDANVVLKIALDIEQQNLENMFLNGDRLVVFYYGSSQTYGIAEYDYTPYPIYTQKTFATIIDISDRKNPETVTKYEIDGNYVNSRMIGDIVYLITNSAVDYSNPIIPRIMEGANPMIPDIYHFPNPEESYTFNTVTAFDVDGKLENSETFLMGYTNTIYVSENNLYITYQKNVPYTYYDTVKKDRFFEVVVPLLPKDVQDQIRSIQNDPSLDPYAKWSQVSKLLQDTYNKLPKEQREKLFTQIQNALEDYDQKIQSDVTRTVIHKIGLDKGNLKYIANSEVPGYLLNQFSMDESGNRFRITTTTDYFSRSGSVTSNNVYVLDENLNQVGSLTKIAPDERIYSARFMGDKLFLVTFKQIDPFFVIDLSSDTPKVLGALKIPGFSNYLQPYDKDHIIGVGRDTKNNEWGGVQTNGIKVSMFDVSDFNNPKETDTIVIGDSGTDSEILYNHKALLLDKEKNIMSIPIKSNYRILFEKDSESTDIYHQKNWNGFYVYAFENNKFVEKGKIAHYIWENSYNVPYMQSRSLYIGDTLYTVMDGSIKMNDLADISNEINTIKIGSTGDLIKPLEK